MSTAQKLWTAAAVAVSLACIAAAVHLYRNRTWQSRCVVWHSEDDICTGMMPVDINSGSMMPYSYPCDRQVCDKQVCERRRDRHSPWRNVACNN